MTSTETARRIPIAPGSVEFDQLPEAIQRDILLAIKRSKETTLRQTFEVEAANKKDKPPMIKQFSETYSDAVRAIQMADRSLTYEQAHERATIKTMAEARAARFALMGDPATAPSVAPAQQQEFDEVLLKSAVDHALTVSADNQPKKPVPEVGTNYRDALAKIASSVPPMARDAAMALVRAAQTKDREFQVARETALANHSPGSSVGKIH